MKRKRASHTEVKARKSTCLADAVRPSSGHADHAVLSVYYPTVEPLRSYLSDASGQKSKRRRRHLVQSGVAARNIDVSSTDKQLAEILDTIYVGHFNTNSTEGHVARKHELEMFSQKLSNSSTGTSLSEGSWSQCEVGDPAFHTSDFHISGQRSPPSLV